MICNLLAGRRFFAVALLFSSFVVAQNVAQTRAMFVGTWQVGIDRDTHKANITVNLVQDGATLSGKMVFSKPRQDNLRSRHQEPILRGPEILISDCVGSGFRAIRVVDDAG